MEIPQPTTSRLYPRPLILVIDDEPLQQKVSVALVSSYADAITCSSSEEAISLIKKHPFDVLLIDDMLDGEDGCHTLQALKEQGCEAHAIAIIPFSRKKVTVECIRAGFYDFIEKPADPKYLEHVILRCTTELRAQRQGRDDHEALMGSERDRTLGSLAGGIAHEINNLNNFIMLNTPIVEQVINTALPFLDRYEEEHGEFMVGRHRYSKVREKIGLLLNGIQEGSERIAKITSSLQTFSRSPQRQVNKTCDLNQAVSSTLALAENLTKRSTQHLCISLNEVAPIATGDSQKIELIILSLIKNACDFLGSTDKSITIKTSIKQDSEHVMLSIADEGCGISEEHLKQVIDPFFTTIRSDGFTGLGLSYVDNAIKALNGNMNICSKVGVGTTITITLPADIQS
jgi:signal transduction histidine kinase